MALCLAFSFITLSSKAEVDPVTGLTVNSTGNILNLGGGLPWGNTVTGAAGGTSGGSTAAYNPGTGNIIFGYDQTTVSQSIAINQALANAGVGIQLSGYKYQWQIQNDLNNYASNRGTLTGNVSLTGPNGNVLESFNYNYNQNLPSFTTFSGTQYFNNRYDTAAASNVTVSFTGKDQNFWAGYYGPRVHVDSFSLLYSIDPCKTNPAYSSTCTKFSTVTTGNNLFNSEVWGSAVTQSFAINTALKNGGIGATVHGFNYGFDYTVGESWFGCTATNQDGSCSWYMNIPAQVSATARLTNSNNQTIYSKSNTLSGDGTSGSVNGQYLLPTSLNQTSLGRVSLTGSTSGTGSSIGNFSASLIYTADPCVSNPLYNASCSGYAVAFAKNMLLGSTVASASGAIVSSGGNSLSANTGQIEQSQGNTQPEQQSQQQQQSSPQQDTNQQTSVAQSDPAQPAPTGAPGPAGGPAQTQASGSSSQQQSGGAGPSKLAMSVVKSSQDKDKATQNAAVSSAAKTLENTMQSSQATSNALVSMNQEMSANSATTSATFAGQSTQTSMQASTQFNQQQTTQSSVQAQQGGRAGSQVQQQDSQQALSQSINVIQTSQFVYTPPVVQQDTQSTQVVILKPPTTQEVETQQSTSGTGIVVTRNLFAYNPVISSSSSNMSISSSQYIPMYQSKLDGRQDEVETPQYQMSSFSGIGKAGNPLSEIMMQQQFELMQTSIAQPGSSVNRNALPNELAGGIDIASIASVPSGFNTYSFVLKDAAFYEPKEVYKNQRTVDNERVLRGLTRGSDSLHQRMVDQQFKLGN